jgi:hypothetical protein
MDLTELQLELSLKPVRIGTCDWPPLWHDSVHRQASTKCRNRHPKRCATTRQPSPSALSINVPEEHGLDSWARPTLHRTDAPHQQAALGHAMGL